jgi:histidinol-phosphate aminotransferase
MANTEAELLRLAENLPEHVIFCLDEAYAEYLEQAPDLRALIEAGRKIVCLRTFSKIYGLGGFRVGYAYGAPDLIALLQRVRQPFNVSSIGQAAATAALRDFGFLARCKAANTAGRDWLCRALGALGIETHGGEANFVLSRVGNGLQVFEQLQQRGIIIRPLAAYGLPEYVRITVGTPEENVRLCEVLSEVLGGGEAVGVR